MILVHSRSKRRPSLHFNYPGLTQMILTIRLFSNYILYNTAFAKWDCGHDGEMNTFSVRLESQNVDLDYPIVWNLGASISEEF